MNDKTMLELQRFSLTVEWLVPDPYGPLVFYDELAPLAQHIAAQDAEIARLTAALAAAIAALKEVDGLKAELNAYMAGAHPGDTVRALPE